MSLKKIQIGIISLALLVTIFAAVFSGIYLLAHWYYHSGAITAVIVLIVSGGFSIRIIYLLGCVCKDRQRGIYTSGATAELNKLTFGRHDGAISKGSIVRPIIWGGLIILGMVAILWL